MVFYGKVAEKKKTYRLFKQRKGKVFAEINKVDIFFNCTLFFSNRIGSVAKIPNAIKAKESVVNLATPHSDEAKAIIDNCMEIPI